MEKNPNVNQQLVGTVNIGYYILDQKEDEAGDTWVIAFSPTKKEFVTWFYNTECGSYSWGHYIRSLEAAYTDFKCRYEGR
jgi:hypothetical protein